MRKSDEEVLSHIISHCEDVEKSIRRFGNAPGSFDANIDYRNSITMSLLQIGELSENLTADFRSATGDKIDWSAVKAMHNFFADNYSAADLDKMWSTALYDIPVLKNFCQQNVKKYEQAEQNDALGTINKAASR